MQQQEDSWHTSGLTEECQAPVFRDRGLQLIAGCAIFGAVALLIVLATSTSSIADEVGLSLVLGALVGYSVCLLEVRLQVVHGRIRVVNIFRELWIAPSDVKEVASDSGLVFVMQDGKVWEPAVTQASLGRRLSGNKWSKRVAEAVDAACADKESSSEESTSVGIRWSSVGWIAGSSIGALLMTVLVRTLAM